MTAMTVIMARVMKKRTLVQDTTIPGSFILQNGGLGSDV